ncbi:hypothetical protein CC78DRAFT_587647 [Lojkania enalia]|uniref:Uncharacterized protein n=1 Tax=Lojkania enalia TaxID=147567 RepID=A0A9P4JYG6_9PLEO|nr:hypothetical protein CC78DRAFT_587647 [Didymosphaeria enalia]
MAVGAPIVESGALTYSIVQIFDNTYTLIYSVVMTDPTLTFAAGDWNFLVDSRENAIEWQLRGHGGEDLALNEAGHFSYQHDTRLHEHHGELLLRMFDDRNNLVPPYVPSEGDLLSLDLFSGSMQVDSMGKSEKYVGYGS